LKFWRSIVDRLASGGTTAAPSPESVRPGMALDLAESILGEDVHCIRCFDRGGSWIVAVLSSWKRDDSGEVVEMTHTCLTCGCELFLIADSPALRKALRQIELLEPVLVGRSLAARSHDGGPEAKTMKDILQPITERL